ncbi:MAG TPA: OPT family oligopeptide transporter [Phycisphaerales bacterium]|nr:OPT family oligopeptide transporter [Phycisphaerales bacterium]
MAAPHSPTDETQDGSSAVTGFAPGVPPISPDASPEEKDAHWLKYVYQGDRMPQLTLRAVLMGGVLGMLMAASNLYTTLTVGWSFGVAITACVMSYVIWNAIRAVSGVSRMSILENTCMASTASAAGYSTGSTIATMFGALLLMAVIPAGKSSSDVSSWSNQPVWIVAIFTLCTGLMGVFLAIPLKRQMINHEQLPFPSGIAAAETLKSLYSESAEAVHKAYALLAGLLVGAIIGVLKVSDAALEKLTWMGATFDWIRNTLGFSVRLPELIPENGFAKVDAGRFTDMGLVKDDHGSTVWASHLASTPGKPLIGFGFEPSVLLIAAGMIVGLRVSISMLVGSILLYVFVAPPLIGMDAAHANETGYVPSIELIGGGTIFHVYRWGLWGGTALMVFASLAALALQWKTIANAFRRKGEAQSHHGVSEAELKAVEVPFSWMVAGMLPITIAMVILQIIAFDISWWAGIIAVAMSFVLSLVACRATGETDTTPIGAMGKVMQLTFAVLAPKNVVANLASAGIAANSASSSADLLTDLKSGYLLGANPRRQFLAQFFGVFFGTLAILPAWYLLVPDRAALERFPAPATNMWYRVAQVLTEGLDSLPNSAKIAILVGALIGIALPVIEKVMVPKSLKPYFPSAMGLGLAWVVPFANSLSFAIGAIVAWVWGMISKKQRDTFNIPIASGFIAGESLLAAIIAMAATVAGLMASSTPPPTP